jgi:hypothetical protein
MRIDGRPGTLLAVRAGGSNCKWERLTSRQTLDECNPSGSLALGVQAPVASLAASIVAAVERVPNT